MLSWCYVCTWLGLERPWQLAFSLESRDWPIAHGTLQWLLASIHIPAKAKDLPHEGTLALVQLLATCMLLCWADAVYLFASHCYQRPVLRWSPVHPDKHSCLNFSCSPHGSQSVIVSFFLLTDRLTDWCCRSCPVATSCTATALGSTRATTTPAPCAARPWGTWACTSAWLTPSWRALMICLPAMPPANRSTTCPFTHSLADLFMQQHAGHIDRSEAKSYAVHVVQLLTVCSGCLVWLDVFWAARSSWAVRLDISMC